MTSPRLVLCLGLAALLAACSAAPDVVTRLPTPNPNPVERFKVTVEVSNAPGEFESAEGFVLFQVTDQSMSCLPRSEFSGAPSVSYAGLMEPFSLKKTSPTTFEGVAALDQFVPSDDYGLGPCDWQPANITARLNNGINVHSSFVGAGLPNSAFDAYVSQFRLSDGLYRGRRAFRLSVYDNDRLLPTDPEPEPDTPLPIFSGGYDDAKPPINPVDFDTYYFITITAERLEHTP